MKGNKEMKFCTSCGSQIPDDANVCPNCGTPVNENVNPICAPDPYDHTSEFDKKDISDNKVVAMLPYLLDIPGLIIAILLTGTSKYVTFHVRTMLKYKVVDTLLFIIDAVLCITFIVPTLAYICLSITSVCLIIVFVLKIISFFQVCSGKAKDPAIIRSLNFLK